MAREMVSLGMLASRAASTAERSRALWSGSPPPVRAATVTSRMSLVKSAPLVAPIASFLRLIFVHRLWPDISSLSESRPHLACARRVRQSSGRAPGRAPGIAAGPSRVGMSLDARALRAARSAPRKAIHLGQGPFAIGSQERDQGRRIVG